jgi:hypothetical protein
MRIGRRAATVGQADRRIVFKSLKDGVSTVQNFTWPLPPDAATPGDWVDTDPKKKIAVCVYGVHGWLTRRRAEQDGNQVFEMEIEGDIVDDHEKAAGRRGRLLRQLSGAHAATLGELADLVTANGAGATALDLAAKRLGVTQASIEKALDGAYTIDDNGELVRLGLYLRKAPPTVGDGFERRVSAMRRFPLALEAARV